MTCGWMVMTWRTNLTRHVIFLVMIASFYVSRECRYAHTSGRNKILLKSNDLNEEQLQAKNSTYSQQSRNKTKREKGRQDVVYRCIRKWTSFSVTGIQEHVRVKLPWRVHHMTEIREIGACGTLANEAWRVATRARINFQVFDKVDS